MRAFIVAIVAAVLLSFAFIPSCKSGSPVSPAPGLGGASQSAGTPESPGASPASSQSPADTGDANTEKLLAMPEADREKRLTDYLYEEILRIYGNPGKGEVRTPARVPEGSGGAVDDLLSLPQPSGAVELLWTYRNPGDYDQNGEVGISDVTEIALNFGKRVADDRTLTVIDGDGNGEIGISDITAIATNFMAAAGRYGVEYLDNTGEWKPADDAPITLATLASADGRKRFSYLLGGGNGGVAGAIGVGTMFRVAPLDASGAAGPYSNVAEYSANQNVFPAAIPTATPESGFPPFTVTLSAERSFDPDGRIVRYEWRTAPGGEFVDYTAASGVAQVEVGAVGMYTAVLRVTDDMGAAREAAVYVAASERGNAPPSAAGHVSPAQGEVPFTAYFDAEGSSNPDGEITHWLWDFGSGVYEDATATEGAAPHAYIAAHEYTARLRVIDDKGGDATEEFTVIALAQEEQPPVAVAQAWPLVGDAPLTTTLLSNASYDPDGTIVKYEWDTDANGSYDTESDKPDPVEVTYQAGSHTARLRVTDDQGKRTVTATPYIISNAASLYWTFEEVDTTPNVDQVDDGIQARRSVAISPVDGTIWMMYPATGVPYAFKLAHRALDGTWSTVTCDLTEPAGADFSMDGIHCAPDGTVLIPAFVGGNPYEIWLLGYSEGGGWWAYKADTFQADIDSSGRFLKLLQAGDGTVDLVYSVREITSGGYATVAWRAVSSDYQQWAVNELLHDYISDIGSLSDVAIDNDGNLTLLYGWLNCILSRVKGGKLETEIYDGSPNGSPGILQFSPLGAEIALYKGPSDTYPVVWGVESESFAWKPVVKASSYSDIYYGNGFNFIVKNGTRIICPLGANVEPTPIFWYTNDGWKVEIFPETDTFLVAPKSLTEDDQGNLTAQIYDLGTHTVYAGFRDPLQ